jgi:isopenicillin-N N-acyltransferase-like protein
VPGIRFLICLRIVVQRTKIVQVEGTPYERGAQMGEAFAAATERSVAFNRRYPTARAVDRSALESVVAPYLAAATEAMPALVVQMRGMADGADRPFLDIFFANAFEEVYGIVELSTPTHVLLERCTSVVTHRSSTVLGHNERWYEGSVGLVLDVSDDGPAILAPMVAGTLPLVGLNEFDQRGLVRVEEVLPGLGRQS